MFCFKRRFDLLFYFVEQLADAGAVFRGEFFKVFADACDGSVAAQDIDAHGF